MPYIAPLCRVALQLLCFALLSKYVVVYGSISVSQLHHDHIMVHSPSLFLLTADRETRVFCFAGFPRLNSSSLPFAFSNPWLALFQYQRLASSRFAGAPIPYKSYEVSTVGGDISCEIGQDIPLL